jgi:hypothetical protein
MSGSADSFRQRKRKESISIYVVGAFCPVREESKVQFDCQPRSGYLGVFKVLIRSGRKRNLRGAITLCLSKLGQAPSQALIEALEALRVTPSSRKNADHPCKTPKPFQFLYSSKDAWFVYKTSTTLLSFSMVSNAASYP